MPCVILSWIWWKNNRLTSGGKRRRDRYSRNRINWRCIVRPKSRNYADEVESIISPSEQLTAVCVRVCACAFTFAAFQHKNKYDLNIFRFLGFFLLHGQYSRAAMCGSALITDSRRWPIDTTGGNVLIGWWIEAWKIQITWIKRKPINQKNEFSSLLVLYKYTYIQISKFKLSRSLGPSDYVHDADVLAKPVIDHASRSRANNMLSIGIDPF